MACPDVAMFPVTWSFSDGVMVPIPTLPAAVIRIFSEYVVPL
jgi:hypothetical protein